jgi:2-C-methyl-D-erythritol 2,4-cyclodiphosphate synthase
MMRVGQGYDIHALVDGRRLIIGGIQIPYHQGLQGHSDADPLLHAIIDALLGAAGLGDIGKHFPDSDPDLAQADSRRLLAQTYRLVRAQGYVVGNIDATVIAQAPKLAPFIPAMIQAIANCLELDPQQINIKAKTNERLGHLGRSEGIAVHAIILLINKKSAARV